MEPRGPSVCAASRMPERLDLRHAPEQDGAVPRQRTRPVPRHRVRHVLTVEARQGGSRARVERRVPREARDPAALRGLDATASPSLRARGETRQ